MFHNGKKTIGVFIQQVNEEYQNLLCRGISKRATELDYNVAIFTNFGGYTYDSYDVGERRIADLPYYEDLDGIILAPDSLNLVGLEELYKEQIRNRCHCPVVSIRKTREGFYNVLVDNSSIMDDVITHLIEVHKYTKINFLAGPRDAIDVNKRLDAYKRILQDHRIPVEDDRIYYGDLWKYAAYDAVDHWFNSTLEWPQAIVCANDIMAMTVCKALEQRGIQVPEQIAVTGCDDIEEAEEFIPAITTVRLPIIEMGMEAVDKIDKHNLGEKQPTNFYVKQTATIYRSSCGCKKDWYQDISERRRMKVEINDLLQVQMIRLSQMSVDLAGKATLFDAKAAVVGNWFEYNTMSHYIFCLKGNWDDYDNNGQTDGQIKMEAGMKNGVGIYDVKFSKKDLIPKELSEDRPMTFYFMKLHYLEHDYGYFGFSIKDGHNTRMLTLQAWLNNVSSALENVRMHMELNRLVSKLEDMSIRDELTGLYNRRVIDTLGRKSLSQGVRDHTKLMFFIADMDKLKDVNDRHGHLKGDLALSTIAEALKKAADDDEICIRLGGDEFMAIGIDYDEEKAESFANRVVEELNRFNKNSDFNIFISYGWNLIYPTENTTVEEGLFTADYRMYQQKYHKTSNHLKVNLFA